MMGGVTCVQSSCSLVTAADSLTARGGEAQAKARGVSTVTVTCSTARRPKHAVACQSPTSRLAVSRQSPQSPIVTGRTALPSRGGGGAGVLDRPGFDRSGDAASAPSTEAGGDMAQLNRVMGTGGGSRYRVLLLDHERHTEDRVARVLPAVVPSVTPDEARRIFVESRELGQGLVTLAVKEHAEFYAQSMAMRGLRSTIQPDGPVL